MVQKPGFYTGTLVYAIDVCGARLSMRRHVQQHDATEYGVLHGDSHRRWSS
jgi:hypothetical protein